MALCPEEVGRGKERPHRPQDPRPGPETGSLLALARCWLGDRPAMQEDRPALLSYAGGVDRPPLTRPDAGPSHRPCGHTLENSRLGPGLGARPLHLPHLSPR